MVDYMFRPWSYTKIEKRFALRPIKLLDKCHWLKWVYIKQRYVYDGIYTGWRDVEFTTKEEYEKYLRRNKNG